jgi:hypothetical protein
MKQSDQKIFNKHIINGKKINTDKDKIWENKTDHNSLLCSSFLW